MERAKERGRRGEGEGKEREEVGEEMEEGRIG